MYPARAWTGSSSASHRIKRTPSATRSSARSRSKVSNSASAASWSPPRRPRPSRRASRDRRDQTLPGYVFVEMQLEPDGRIPQDVFFLIKETSGVGDFVGTAGRPTPMATHEVEKMLFDSRKPEEEEESNSSSSRATRSRSTTAPSPTWRAPWTKSSPRKARARPRHHLRPPGPRGTGVLADRAVGCVRRARSRCPAV